MRNILGNMLSRIHPIISSIISGAYWEEMLDNWEQYTTKTWANWE